MEQYIARCINWMNKGYVVYAVLGVAFIGFLSRFIAGLVYDMLIRETENFSRARSNFVKLVKMKYENSYKLNLSIHNNDAFVDKLLSNYKICGVTLHGLRKASVILGMFCVILLCFQAALGGMAGLGIKEQFWNGLHGALALLLLFFSCMVIDLKYKHSVVRNNLLDYLENSLKNRMVHEYVDIGVVEENKKAAPDISQMKEQLSKTEEKKEKKRKLNQAEEEAVIQEILREFFA